MAIDVEKLKLDNNIVDVIGNRITLHKRGSEYYGICPFHNDTEQSLQVNETKQVFKCFVCNDKGGDSIAFLQYMGLSFKEAAIEINSGIAPEQAFDISQGDVKEKKIKANPWKHVYPATAPQSAITHYLHGVPSRIDKYHTYCGGIYGFACRFDLANGKKVVLPYIYASDGNRSEWRWQGFDSPRLPYNAHLIEKFPKSNIIIVEGEKTAEAAQKQLDPEKSIVITWLGGADGVRTTSFDKIVDRKIIYWRDNDFGFTNKTTGAVLPWHEQPGTRAMLDIHDSLKNTSKTFKWVNIPAGYPNKWDAADKEWTPGELGKFVKENLIDVPVRPEKVEPEKKPVKKERPKGPVNPPLPVKEIDEDQDLIVDTEHFRVLGYDKDESGKLVYFFFSHSAKTVVKLSPSSMTKPNLLMLAPINYWEREFRGEKSKVDSDQCQQFLISMSHKCGIFKESYIRGRGAWMDDEKIVIHTGDKLLIENKLFPLKNFRSKYLYEIGERLGFSVSEPLATVESSKFIEKMKWLAWEREINAYLLAGWCVVAPFCGILNWRPHIWITGPSGSGKSWTLDNVLKRILGDSPIVVQGKTTEPGIRGLLQNDARPVLFDETDVDNNADTERIQSILALARSSSYSNGGVIGKGTQSGGSRSYEARTCMAFSSIGIQLNQQSDRSRFTILSLMAHENKRSKDEFTEFGKDWMSLVTEDYVKALQSRTIQLLPVILKNAQTFTDAATTVLGQKRIGEQIGIMLAGAYSLSKTKEISYSEAIEWVESRDWADERGLELTKDESQLFGKIMGYITRVESEYGTLDRSIGELILVAAEKHAMRDIVKEVAVDRLRRLGILIIGDRMYLSNTADGIKAIVKGTSWEKNHHAVLARLEGAEKVDQRSYGPGGKSRGISLPLSMLDGSDIKSIHEFIDLNGNEVKGLPF